MFTIKKVVLSNSKIAAYEAAKKAIQFWYADSFNGQIPEKLVFRDLTIIVSSLKEDQPITCTVKGEYVINDWIRHIFVTRFQIERPNNGIDWVVVNGSVVDMEYIDKNPMQGGIPQFRQFYFKDNCLSK